MISFSSLLFLVLVSFASVAQPTPQSIAFKLKNNLGYHRMFRVEGPGIAYGFTMSRNETVAKSWPVGAKLYYSSDGEISQGLIFTVDESLEGQIVPVQRPDKKAPSLPEVTLRFKNNSLWFRKLSLISYRPDETGNGTVAYWLAPYGSREFQYPVGTRLYLADQAEVRVVMSGKRLTGKPFLVVAATDEGKTYPVSR